MSRRPASPYKGLSAFDDSGLDALLFFGREREREIVVANLIASRLTVLYGPSGVGKSSLLCAAVARSLRELPEEPLVVVFSRWSDDPAAGLADAIAEASGARPEGLPVEAVRSAQAQRDVYLILDQAEEYFLYHADDRGPGSFAEALPELLGAQLRVNVLVSLREDSLAKLDRFTGRISGLFANTLRLDRLDRRAASSAIVGPVARYAELTGEPVGVEGELVGRVLDEVGTGRIEPALGGQGAVERAEDGGRIEAPYLQLVMQRLWEEERESGSTTLRASTLERLGGAQQIVEEHLEGALDELSGEGKDIAARLFNHLVTPSGTKIAHEVADLADFGGVPPDELRPVLSTLADRRILRSLEEGGTVRYEIFHDVLAHPVLAWRARHRTEREIEAQVAERHRRRSRLQRVLGLAILVLALVVAAVAFALVQRGNAQEQERDARARRLDAAALAVLPTDPELSLLLAAESAKLAPGPASEDALRQALLASRVQAVGRSGGPVRDVAFSPGGALLAFASDDGRARVRDVASGRTLFTRRIGADGGVSFARNGRSLLLHGDAGPPVEVSSETGQVLCVFDRAGRPAADAALAGRYVVTVRNARGYVWSRSGCRLLRTVEDVGARGVWVVASSNGSRVAFVSLRDARIADLPSGDVALRLEHPTVITSLAFSSDGFTVLTGGRDGNGRVWSGATGRLRRQLRGQRGQILDVALVADGTLAATASADGTARVWDVLPGTVRSVLFGHTNFVVGVAFSTDEVALVTASLDGTARTWTTNGKPLEILAGHAGAVLDATFSRDGATVATGGEDGTVRLWDVTRLDLVRTDAPAPPRARLAATTSNGELTARVDGRSVRLAGSDGPVGELSGHSALVTSVDFSPDGRRLVTASKDRDAILWDVESGQALRVLRAHFGTVTDARFSPDGRWIATAGPVSVGLWSASTGELVKLLYGPPGAPLTAVSFGGDSRTITAVTGDGVVIRYDCRVCGEVSQLLELAERRLAATGRALTPEERELYLG